MDQRKFFLSYLPGILAFWEFFSWNGQTHRFIYPSRSQILWSNQAWWAKEANRFFNYPLKEKVPLSSDLILFLKGVTIFYCVVAVTRPAVQFTLKKSLVYPLCGTVSTAVSFRSAHIFYHSFSCGIFCSNTWNSS